jgi:hypothetical protein
MDEGFEGSMRTVQERSSMEQFLPANHGPNIVGFDL